MSDVHVRLFRRGDREQLTELVNAHAAAVVPGLSISVSTVLSQLERQPDEFVVDPWVAERRTLVAEQHQRVAAAAHLLRYAQDDRVSVSYRDSGEIRWLVFWPDKAGDATGAAEQLMTACLGLLDGWAVSSQSAAGDLPVPGVFGVPAQWAHVRALYERSGFRHVGHTELVYLARVEHLARPPAPVPGLSVRRSVGSSGTRFSAVLSDEVVGYLEIEIFHGGERRSRHSGWADIGNLGVGAAYRRRGIATWLLGQAAGWLELAHVDRLLAYTYAEGSDETGQSYDEDRAFLQALPFAELTRTKSGWKRS